MYTNLDEERTFVRHSDVGCSGSVPSRAPIAHAKIIIAFATYNRNWSFAVAGGMGGQVVHPS